KASDEADEKYRNLGPRAAEELTTKQLQQIQARRRTTHLKFDRLSEELEDYEVEHGITVRWALESPEYLAAEDDLDRQDYRQALERLERLVVQRLFELTKLNMSGVGYKQRTKITQALKSRAEAIRKALDAYNTAAERMDPPRATISWNTIIEMATLAEFDLLKDTHLNIAQLPWARPENRQAMQLHFGIRRAEEEVVRLNVEIKRLVTFMLDDHADYHHAIAATELSDPELAVELSRQQFHRLAIHAHIAERLVQTSQLQGFTDPTGDLLPGARRDREPELTDSVPLLTWATDIIGIQELHEDPGNTDTSAQPATPAPSDEELDAGSILAFLEGLTMDSN
ncbi:hypothetical protein V5O48_015882, partial [Marasmius crinis-equi]